MAELQKAAQRNKYGYMFSIARSEYIRQVTEASQELPVVVFLYKDRYPLNEILIVTLIFTIVDCKILKEVLDRVAERQPMVKFVQMISTDCIADYPDRYISYEFFI